MGIVYKVLGQSNPSPSGNVNLYTVPSATEAVISTLAVCNTSAYSSTYRLAIRPTGESISNKHYIAYDAPIEANNSVMLTLGLSLASSDVITVYAAGSGIAFNAFGTEIS